jgi:hypothetical protein
VEEEKIEEKNPRLDWHLHGAKSRVTWRWWKNKSSPGSTDIELTRPSQKQSELLWACSNKGKGRNLAEPIKTQINKSTQNKLVGAGHHA